MTKVKANAKSSKAVQWTAIGPEQRLRLWVRSGGRCAICNRSLMEGKLTAREVRFGQMAHIVGQKTSSKSPRGMADLDPSRRDDAENLILVCEDEHVELDKDGTADAFAVDWLRVRKAEHESRIEHTTGIDEDRSTVILRLLGDLRNRRVGIDRGAAAFATLKEGRYARFSLAFDKRSIEIDLRGQVGEEYATRRYYKGATTAIDEVIAGKVNEGLHSGKVAHLSVFGFARLPLLVYLGCALDDNIPADVYQLHRSTSRWEWPDPAPPPPKFIVRAPNATQSGTEAVVIFNVSGTTHARELPERVRDLPLFVVSTARPEQDVISSRAALETFRKALRRLLGTIEAHYKSVERLHVFGGLPISAAIELGRLVDPHVHPALVLYDRQESGYKHAITVGA